MNGIFFLMGSNVGNRLKNLRDAESKLIKKGIQIVEESSIYETEPWGKSDQEWFLNVVVQIETSESPQELLQTILCIEEEIGRVREEKWGARIIDIDILYFYNQVVTTKNLKIPHDGIPIRKFTLVPLVEMQPFEKHPVSNKSQTEMLAECTDLLDCRLTDYKL